MAQKINPAQSSRELGYSEKSTGQSGINSTNYVDLTGLSVTVEVPEGATIKITGWIPQIGSTVSTDRVDLSIFEGSTRLATLYATVPPNGGAQTVMARIKPTAGTHTYKLAMARGVGTGSVAMYADATTKAFIMVETV